MDIAAIKRNFISLQCSHQVVNSKTKFPLNFIKSPIQYNLIFKVNFIVYIIEFCLLHAIKNVTQMSIFFF